MKLGVTQKLVLKSLVNSKSQEWPSDWIWGTYSGTNRALFSMVKHGLVEIIESSSNGNYHTYRATKAGIQMVQGKKP